MTETQTPYQIKNGRLFHGITGEDMGAIYDPAYDPARETKEEQEEQSEDTTALTVIDPSQPDNLVPSITNLPLHFKAMQLEKYTPEEQAEKVFQSTEYLGKPAIPLKRFANQDITVIGGAMIFHPPYMKNDKLHPNTLMPGYYKANLRLDDGTIVETSAWRVTQMLAALLPALGWFDWPISVTFHVEVDDNNAQYLRRVVKK